jgi:hypothetical protein
MQGVATRSHSSMACCFWFSRDYLIRFHKVRGKSAIDLGGNGLFLIKAFASARRDRLTVFSLQAPMSECRIAADPSHYTKRVVFLELIFARIRR